MSKSIDDIDSGIIATTKPASFPDIFPYDILHLILRTVAIATEPAAPDIRIQTLRSLSLVSHSFHADVNPFLWSTIWIPFEDEVSLVLTACAAITRLPHRAAYIKKLIFGADSKNKFTKESGLDEIRWAYPPKIHGYPFVVVEAALRAMPNLEHLVIGADMVSMVSPRPYAWSFCALLDSLPWRSPNPPFRLKKLQLACTVIGLRDFLASQPSIESLEVRHDRPFRDITFPSFQTPPSLPSASASDTTTQLSIPSPLLPNLRHVDAPTTFLGEILSSHRSIKHIGLPLSSRDRWNGPAGIPGTSGASGNGLTSLLKSSQSVCEVTLRGHPSIITRELAALRDLAQTQPRPSSTSQLQSQIEAANTEESTASPPSASPIPNPNPNPGSLTQLTRITLPARTFKGLRELSSLPSTSGTGIGTGSSPTLRNEFVILNIVGPTPSFGTGVNLDTTMVTLERVVTSGREREREREGAKEREGKDEKEKEKEKDSRTGKWVVSEWGKVAGMWRYLG